MRSKSFETQEVREIAQIEAGELKGFPILWMGIIEDIFQMKRKGCKNQERLKMCWRKSLPERERCFSMGQTTLSGPAAVNEKRFVAVARSLAGEKGKQKDK